jgi:AmmeMemoRadiSam system protein A
MSIFVELAKESIREVFDSSIKIDKEYYTKQEPSLLQTQASFVTLNKNHSLRGCIGSIIPTRELFDDIVRNAKLAAFNDHRFTPLTIDEFDLLEIDVSILTIPQEVEYSSIDELKSKLTTNDGVIILLSDGKQATFLPQVWKELNSFELFFSHLCQKAGSTYNCLEQHPQIFTYQAEIYR